MRKTGNRTVDRMNAHRDDEPRKLCEICRTLGPEHLCTCPTRPTTLETHAGPRNNKDRAASFAGVIEHYMETLQTCDTERDAVVDILADAMHYCHGRHDINALLSIARDHYETETKQH